MEKQTANKATKKSAAAHDPRTEALERIVRAEDSDPFQILGPHWIERAGKHTLAIRLFRPGASEARIIWKNGAVSAAGKIAEGLFEAVTDPVAAKLPADAPVPVMLTASGSASPTEKPSTLWTPTLSRRFSPTTISIFSAKAPTTRNTKSWRARPRGGRRSRRAFRRLGAQRPTRQRRRRFQSLGRPRYPMRNRGNTGIWELFIPELDEGALYKFEILSARGASSRVKSDPYGFAAEMRPNTASIVSNIDHYMWNDAAGWKRAPARLAACADVHLRSPPGLLAPQRPARKPLAHLPRTGRRADSLREADGLHAYRVDAASWSIPSTLPGAIRPSAISP